LKSILPACGFPTRLRRKFCCRRWFNTTIAMISSRPIFVFHGCSPPTQAFSSSITKLTSVVLARRQTRDASSSSNTAGSSTC
jgi:hypothetical protein